MTQVSVQDLFAEIGRLTIENKVLRAENDALKQATNNKQKEEDNDVPSEVQATVS